MLTIYQFGLEKIKKMYCGFYLYNTIVFLSVSLYFGMLFSINLSFSDDLTPVFGEPNTRTRHLEKYNKHNLLPKQKMADHKKRLVTENHKEQPNCHPKIVGTVIKPKVPSQSWLQSVTAFLNSHFYAAPKTEKVTRYSSEVDTARIAKRLHRISRTPMG